MASIKTCRTCLKEGNIAIFGHHNFELIKSLKIIAGLHVYKEEPFTKFICVRCYNFLQSAVLFRETAQASYKWLKDQWGKTKNDNISTTTAPKLEKEYGIESSYSTLIGNIVDKFSKEDDKTGMKINEIDTKYNIKIEPESNSDTDNFDEIPLSELVSKTVKKIQHSKRETVRLRNEVECKICKRHVPKNRYNGHLALHNGIPKPDDKMECKLCHKVLLRKQFRSHIALTHGHGGKTFICDQCGKEFLYQGSYTSHLACHKTEYPFRCEKCDYRGSSKQRLVSHMKSHNKDYIYQCHQCSKKFTHKSSLQRHLTRSHKERGVKCSECEKTFFSKLDADRHYEVDHLGLKNFSCNICNKDFGYSHAMRKHQQKVHKVAVGNRGPGPVPRYLRDKLKED